MRTRDVYHYGGLAAGVFLVGAAVFFLFSGECMVVKDTRPVLGSQGYRIFTNAVFKSFEHGGRAVCVPEGWLPIGGELGKPGIATFPVGKTGVIIKQDSFASRTVRPQGSPYEVTVLYPLVTERVDLTRTLETITETFSIVARLYDDVPREPRTPHTVLVTAGIAGGTKEAGTRVYPDPSGALSIFVRTPDHERATGLFVHAVMHLYNRFRLTSPYTSAQEPFTAEEFEELEATWAETALSTWPDAAFERLMYLYKVHSAVVSQNPSLASEPPFNNRAEFEKIVPTVFVRGSTHSLDYQYGHYVLLPLTVAAIDALLYERETGLTVERMLRDIHAGKRSNFMTELALILPEKDYKNVEYWLKGDAQIPLPLIESAIKNVYGR